jgi:hypothetical protein
MTSSRRERAALLAARREALVALAQVQRDALAPRWRRLHAPLQWFERGLQVLSFARAHAWTVILPVGLLMVLRPRWIGRGIAAFSVLSRVGRWLR